MTSEWRTNVNKARPRQTTTWRKTFKWTHFTTVWKREWIDTVIVYIHEVVWSIHSQSRKRNMTIKRGIPVATVMLYNLNNFPGLCSYNARLFNNDVTVSGVSYWRRREFSSYARLHRGRISHPIHCLMWDVIIHHCPVFSGGLTKPPLGIGWESGGGGFSASRDIISYVIYLFKCLIFYAWHKL